MNTLTGLVEHGPMDREVTDLLEAGGELPPFEVEEE